MTTLFHPLRTARTALLLGALLAPLGACGEEATEMLGTRGAGDATAVQARLVVPELVRHGTLLPISVQLTNPRTVPVTVPLLGTPQQLAFDVWLTAPDGTRVWQLHPAGLPAELTGAATTITIEPGAFTALPAIWDLRLPSGVLVAPGTYRVDAHVLTPTGPITAVPVQVMIAP